MGPFWWILSLDIRCHLFLPEIVFDWPSNASPVHFKPEDALVNLSRIPTKVDDISRFLDFAHDWIEVGYSWSSQRCCGLCLIDDSRYSFRSLIPHRWSVPSLFDYRLILWEITRVFYEALGVFGVSIIITKPWGIIPAWLWSFQPFLLRNYYFNSNE